MLLQNENWYCIVSLLILHINYSFHILSGHCGYFSLVLSLWSLSQIFLHVLSTGSQEAVSSSKSFLFSLYNINGYAPVKVNIKSSQQSYSSAIYGCSDYGPAFGAGFDLYISNNAASNRKSFTNCGWTYPLPPGYDAPHSSCRFYAGGSSFYFTPTDVEVFFDDNNLRRWCKTYDSANFYGLAKWKWSTWSLYLKFSFFNTQLWNVFSYNLTISFDNYWAARHSLPFSSLRKYPGTFTTGCPNSRYEERV